MSELACFVTGSQCSLASHRLKMVKYGTVLPGYVCMCVHVFFIYACLCVCIHVYVHVLVCVCWWGNHKGQQAGASAANYLFLPFAVLSQLQKHFP